MIPLNIIILGARLRDHLHLATLANSKVTDAFEEMVGDIEARTGLATALLTR